MKYIEIEEIITNIRFEISQEGNLNAYARLFVLEDGQVVKVFYKSEEIAQKNLHNLKLIAERVRQVDFPELALPTAYLSHNGKTVGYLMPYISGICLAEALLDDRIPFAQKISWFNEIAWLICRLPSMIHIGDLHMENVMIGENGHVSFIDIDGFSVDDGYALTCPMYYEKSLAQNIFVNKYFHPDNSTKIGKNSDIYCLFSLFFEFLLGGYQPYRFSPKWQEIFFEYLRAKGIAGDVVSMFAQITREADNFLLPLCFEGFLQNSFSYEDFLLTSGLLEEETRADSFLRQFMI